ncbi:MAG: dephospho-CoA kinase [Bacteroidales bacterium]|nr:dephospho-CoA kinase [Bacteroidales bacterium]
MSRSIFKLGITGGIGSGKTSVCKVFEILGIPVFLADLEARKMMDNDTEIIRQINSAAGTDLYTGGDLDRQRLAGLIFNDRLLLEKVNSIIHPLVFANFTGWAADQKAPYVIMEAAILFESGGYKLVDKVATIVAPLEERIERIVKRNKLTRDQVMERVRNQMDDDSNIRLSDYVIRNSENDMIIPAILEIHQDILNLIKKREA